MSKWSLYWMLALVTGALVACSGYGMSNGDNDDGFNVGENNGDGEATDVAFVLENDTDHELYVEEYTFPSPGWVAVTFDGEEIYIREDECMLPCACEGEQQCALCDVPAPSTRPLEAGQELRYDWDGVYYDIVENDGETCYEDVQLEGEVMEAEFCWSFDDGSSSEPGVDLPDPSCESVEFEQGVDEEVVVTVEEGPEPADPDVEFVLDNQLDESVVIQQGTEPSPSWMSVLDGADELYLNWDCALPCRCTDGSETPECMDCDMMPPSTVELGADEQVQYQWDGVEYRIVDDPEGGSCFEEIQRTDDELTAEFCWGDEAQNNDDFGEYVAEPTCETVDFELGADHRVEVTIEDDDDGGGSPETDFVIENETDDDIYVQRGEMPLPSWLSVLWGDEEIYVDYDCSLPCPCNDEPCAGCAMPIPTTAAVEPGDEERFSWDAVMYDIVEDDGETCYEEVQMQDESLTAELCYGFETEETGNDLGDESYVKDPVCETFDFQLDDVDEVVAVVE